MAEWSAHTLTFAPFRSRGGTAAEGDGHGGEDLPDGGQPDSAGLSAEQQVQGGDGRCGWGPK